MPALPRLEIAIYFLIYGLFLMYGVVNVFCLRNQLANDAHYGLTNGWNIIGGKRDDSNVEWESFKVYLWKNFLWYLTHAILTEICRFLEPKLISVTHSFIGLAYILATYQMQTILTIFCQLLTFYAISHFHRKNIVWLLACIWIAVINVIKNSPSLYRHETYSEHYELIVVLSWCILKCLSFSLSRIQCHDAIELEKYYNFQIYCGYCLYLPTLVYGPFMIFDRYKRCTESRLVTLQNLELRGKILLRNLFRIIGWLLFIDLALHFVYVSYVEQDIEVVKSLSPWALYGFGYLMGQLFHCHYVVFYGIGTSFAKFDQIHAPIQPRCIGRIHFYSDMWKYFDQGLYEFLFLYIYCSLCQKSCSQQKKIFASSVTFIFIFLWHGFFDYVLVWSVLNFICLSIEKSFKYFVNTNIYVKFVSSKLNSHNQNRVYALLGSQILMSSSISNIYFFAGIDVGNYFVQRTYQSGFFNYVGLSVGFYCIFQSAKHLNECGYFSMSSK